MLTLYYSNTNILDLNTYVEIYSRNIHESLYGMQTGIGSRIFFIAYEDIPLFSDYVKENINNLQGYARTNYKVLRTVNSGLPALIYCYLIIENDDIGTPFEIFNKYSEPFVDSNVIIKKVTEENLSDDIDNRVEVHLPKDGVIKVSLEVAELLNFSNDRFKAIEYIINNVNAVQLLNEI